MLPPPLSEALMPFQDFIKNGFMLMDIILLLKSLNFDFSPFSDELFLYFASSFIGPYVAENAELCWFRALAALLRFHFRPVFRL